MGDGNGGTGADGDPFAELRAAGFFDNAPHEPSAEERRRAAERRARQADLQRRLAEEAEHDRRLAERDRKVRRRQRFSTGTTAWSVGTSRYRNFIAPAVALALLGVVYVSYVRNDGAVTSVLDAPVPRPDDYPPIDRTASDVPLGAPPAAPSVPGAYEFLHTQDGSDAPVAWDPCRPVRYVVNPDAAPPGSEVLIAEAVARVAAATGLVFVDEGTTDERWTKQRDPYQPERYGEKWAPALIAWSSEAETSGLAGYIAGMGGPIGRSTPGDSSGELAYVSGQVVLDAGDLGPALAVSGGAENVRAVIQHELGHMVGLDHVADREQVMFSESLALDWGAGDLAGLHRLGSGKCFPKL